MQKFCFSKIFGAGCIIAAVILGSSCVSRLPQHDTRAFGIIGTGADVYIVAPVMGNDTLLKTLFTSFVPEKTASQYLSRTSVLYIGANYGMPPSVTVVSSGSYPVSLGDFLFPKKDGWEKYREQSYLLLFCVCGHTGTGKNGFYALRRQPAEFSSVFAANSRTSHSDISAPISSIERVRWCR